MGSNYSLQEFADEWRCVDPDKVCCGPRRSCHEQQSKKLAWQYAIEKKSGDRDAIMQAIALAGPQADVVLSAATMELRGDRAVVLQAVSHTGCALRHATEELRSDRDFVLQATTRHGDSFQYASERLRRDSHIIEAALASGTGNVAAILESAGLKGHFALKGSSVSGASVCLAVSPGTSMHKFKTAVLQRFTELAKRMRLPFQPNPDYFDCFVGLNNITDEMIVECWPELQPEGVTNVTLVGSPLGLAKMKMMHGDVEAALIAVKFDGSLLRFAPAHLRDMEDIVMCAVANNGLALEFASARLQDTHQVALQAVLQNGIALQFASATLRADPDIALGACQDDVRAFQFVPRPSATADMLCLYWL
mmetsp:Transcript_69206/g.129166  ORF Transcript_69206/g.129166 Transcript_69206/m.129166 type:complete len:364 (-) Transcript_69206:116-1207(-)